MHINALDEWINTRHVYRKMPHCGRVEKFSRSWEERGVSSVGE